MATFTITSLTDIAGDTSTGAIDQSGNGSGTLRQALNFANQNVANPGTVTTINVQNGLAGTITLAGNLPLVATSITLNGGGLTISGNNGQFRGFIVSGIAANGQSAASTAVNIADLSFANVAARGGSGANGGGGGLGAGGAVFVGPAASVTLTNVDLSNAQAIGGLGAANLNSGGIGPGGGGGGLGGSGGGRNGDQSNGAGGGGLFFDGGATSDPNNGVRSGGGGGGGITSAGGSTSDTSGGNGGAGLGGLGGGGGGFGRGGSPPGSGGGTGASAGDTDAFTGASGGGFGGGGGGVFASGDFGAAGGFGGGGGGAVAANSGVGGFGGGGGGSSGTGSRGGFGGGGGGGSTASGSSGFGASVATGSGGGNGAGLGGAIFVTAGGTLTINGASTEMGSSATQGGAAAGTGGFGAGIFYEGNPTSGTAAVLTFGSGNQTFASQIADLNGAARTTNTDNGLGGSGGVTGLTKNGTGTLTLSGANTYTGGTTLRGGATLELSTLAAAGSGVITFGSNDGETLQLDAAGSFGNRISGFGGLDKIDLNTVTAAGATLVQSTSGGVTTLTITEAAASGSDSNTISIDPAPVDRRYALSADRFDGSALIQLLELPQYSIGVVPRQNGNNLTTSYPEGTGVGSGSAIEYLITRFGDTSQAGSVNVSFSGGATPPGGVNADYNVSAAQGVYQATGVGTGVVSFAAGQSGVRIFANTTPDSVSEADETLTVSLTGVASGGGDIDPQIQNFATATIANDDMAPTLALSQAISSRAEGNAGTTPFSFNVTRTGDAQQMQTVQYAVTGSGSNPATASDFDAAFLSGVVRFEQGQTLQQIVIPAIGDTNFEPDETFTVTLSNPNFGTITTATATGTIINDDAAPPDPGPSGPTPGDDNLFGTAGPDTASLGLGNDSYTGGAGSDLIYGNQGNDLIYGNQDADTLYGGQGDDRVYGGQGDDRLYGNLGNDVLFGNLGADIVYGNQGNDIVYGNQGADILFGGQGNDVLYGGQDNDTLVGGIGDDTLVGGLGADLYRFDPNSGRDLILGFNQGDGDRIALGGQTYMVSTAQNGDALLLLSGGGMVDLAGIRADQVNASYFVA